MILLFFKNILIFKKIRHHDLTINFFEMNGLLFDLKKLIVR